MWKYNNEQVKVMIISLPCAQVWLGFHFLKPMGILTWSQQEPQSPDDLDFNITINFFHV